MSRSEKAYAWRRKQGTDPQVAVYAHSGYPTNAQAHDYDDDDDGDDRPGAAPGAAAVVFARASSPRRAAAKCSCCCTTWGPNCCLGA